ncbi:MAG TPA: ABC transporter permease, partial [Armatimonadota bacterium]|nr:ABC transporter permease [Armatimonadota bacterium]
MAWRKLWADTRALTRQTIALNVLIFLGVMLFVDLHASYENLTGTYDHIYETGRMADASVLFDIGPESLVDKARTIPHVTEAMGRVVRDGSINQRGRERERVLGRFIGCPRGERPAINDVLVLEGKFVTSPGEAVLEQRFASDNAYALGDRIKCVYGLVEREFTVVGIAESPEYIYPVPSKHEVFVAAGTFGVVWIEEDEARSWLGVGRQITELHCRTEPGFEQAVLDRLEGVVHAHGLEASYVQDDQPSNRLLAIDQQGFAAMSVFFPVMFLGIAGLSLYGALSRIIRLQVTIIGTLRASGFSQRAILTQHVGQGTLVAMAGAIPGVVVGHFVGASTTNMYAGALHLPIVLTPPRWTTMLIGLVLAAVTGFVASLLPAWTAARLAPAVAMRGDSGGGDGAVGASLIRWTRIKEIALRIPLRGIFRRPSRTFIAVAGIAGGASIIITTFGMHLATMDAIDEFLTGTIKYELSVQFTHPNGMPTARAVVEALDGRSITPTASLPIRVESSYGSGELILTGLETGQRLLQPRTLGDVPLHLRPGEIWLPKQLAGRLLVDQGDPVRVGWVRSDQRRRVGTTMRVGGILDVTMGNAAYGEVNDVRRSLADRAYPESSYGAFISCDPSRVEAIRSRLESSDDLALVSTTADAERQIDEQMGVMFIFIGCLLTFGGILAGSVIHGISSVSLLERTRELAALR